MELKIFHQFSDINEQDWNSLLSQSETDVPFLRYGYLRSWWEYKGGGEWPDESRLMLITGWENNTLVAIAPLFSTANSQEKKILFLGSIEISDYLDFICLPAYKDIFIELVLDSLHNTSEEFARIELVNLPKISTSVQLLGDLAQKTNWKAAVEDAYHTPAIHLASDWEAYLAGIDKKQRHEIRRKLRRAEENSDSIKWYIAKEPEKLDADINAFISLMEMDDKKKDFLSARMRDQMRSIIHWAFGEDILQLSFLEIDGKKAASYLCFDYNTHLMVYNSGFDYSFGEYSPGWVLLSYLIQHAINSGKAYFDFMRGNESYKYRFGAEDGFVLKVTLDRS